MNQRVRLTHPESAPPADSFWPTMTPEEPATLLVRRSSRRWLTGRLLSRRLTICLLATFGLAAASVYESRTSYLQAYLISRFATQLSWEVGPGPSPSIVFPKGGPFDKHRGYSSLRETRERLEGAGYRLREQARVSEAMARLASWGIPLPYAERVDAGLVIRDAAGSTLYDARAGEPVFRSFEDIPAVVVESLLFIENRELAEASSATVNPAVDWARFAKAGALYAGRQLGLPFRLEGGSTLATQMEKYRHWPGGRTESSMDKVRQMVAASLRAYRTGTDTTEERRAIVTGYLNTMPLSAAPGRGEIYGLGEGLNAWFGMSLDDVVRLLAEPDATPGKARAFKHALALLYAVHAPTYYLSQNRQELRERVAAYEDMLATAGIVGPFLHRLMKDVELEFADGPMRHRAVPPAQRKAVSAARLELLDLVGLQGFYDLDRLDLEVESTIDAGLQDDAARLFTDLTDPAFLDAKGLRGERLLETGDPSRVVYTLMLLERTPGGNLVRVQADSLPNRPFDANEGMKLELGSTAKLRALAHYLDLVDRLHDELSGLGRKGVRRKAALARDPITEWVARTMLREPRIGKEELLDRAMERTYSSATGETFFTGGGAHTFSNFDPNDDGGMMTVRQAVVSSTNLVFIRLMRDLVEYHEARLPYDTRVILSDPDNPMRRMMVEELAAEEARSQLKRAWSRYEGVKRREVVARLLGDRATSPPHLAIVFYAWHHGAGEAQLARWLESHGAPVTDSDLRRLARGYGGAHLGLLDYGYLLDRHPLEVWVAGRVASERGVTWDGLLAASGPARAESSAWLLHRRQKAAQNLRLRTRFEKDAFARMTPAWRALGFPFDTMVPSLASAIGSSSDRPAALADLMGIIMNDGRRLPVHRLRSMTFASGTPYHTVFEASESDGDAVISAPVARALRDVLAKVVEQGTARRLHGVFTGYDGEPVVAGGKTGSGDNRVDRMRGGKLISSRAVSRTAAFAFYIGDRYFGVITASVIGREAEGYRFTSALPLAVLQLLAPGINERLAAPHPAAETTAIARM